MQKSFKCLRATESVNGTNFLCLGMTQESYDPQGKLAKGSSVRKQDIKDYLVGLVKVANSFLFCIVLDHVTTSTE